MVTQFGISESAKYFTPYFNNLLGVRCSVNPHSQSTYFTYEPTLQVGMYTRADYEFVMRMRNRVYIIWCGADAVSNLLDDSITKQFNEHNNITHISVSDHITKALNSLRNVIQIHVPFTDLDFWYKDGVTPKPGIGVYTYAPGDDTYVNNGGFYNSVRTELPCTFIEVTRQDKYSKDELYKVYEDSFIGIRFRTFDRTPASVVEMALMGRPYIWGGTSPGSLEFRGDSSPAEIRDILMHTLALRKEPDAGEKAAKLAARAYSYYSAEESKLRHTLEFI